MRLTYLDRDYIKTKDGLIFCVIGYEHPNDKVISFLKYIPTKEQTIWSSGFEYFKRIMTYYSAERYVDIISYLKENYPKYVVYDQVFGIELIEVPKDSIEIHYKPEERIIEIYKNPKDNLEEKVIEIVDILARESNTLVSNFGITGSILIKIHNVKYSDIDLIIYGKENALKVIEALRKLHEDKIFELNKEIVHKWAVELCEHHNLTIPEAMKIYFTKLWRSVYKGTVFSVHPVRSVNEVSTVRYGSKIYRAIGEALLKAIITDDEDSIFLPAIYKVKVLDILSGVKIDNIKEIVSYEGIYSGIAKINDIVYAYGTIEKVHDLEKGIEYYRLVVGSSRLKGRDFIKPKWLIH